MNRITEYDILWAEFAEDLAYRVRFKMEDGWQPYGSLYYNGYHHYQAVVKYEAPTHLPR